MYKYLEMNYLLYYVNILYSYGRKKMREINLCVYLVLEMY